MAQLSFDEGDRQHSGRVVTFYSFKGGVGRTMALANTAFLAAVNGLDVLVMDWDLEAPGLHHYFRGIMDPGALAELRQAEGVLDLAWKWKMGLEEAQDADGVDKLFAHFVGGDPFKSTVHTVQYANPIKEWGKLDLITAGASEISTPAVLSYEEALAALNWNEFLEGYAGGGMLKAMRDWATSNYDLVLVDSRTGLADVAGICTTQLPDAVVLAFILNRQNIDGISRVAGAIRASRGDEVRIWPVPMRISREGTAEEADASARAARELSRIGGLDRPKVEQDMKSLLIRAEANVPFMESLSAFNDTNAALDPLTASYARLTMEIVGREISIPEIDDGWRDTVNSRLAPALSTEAYLRQLINSEPERAAREIHHYVESAISALADEDDVPESYVATLIDTAFTFEQRGAFSDIDYDTSLRVVDLLRRLYEHSPDRWRTQLAEALETQLHSDLVYYDTEDEIAVYEEIDALLAPSQQSVDILLWRARIKLHVGRRYGMLEDQAQRLIAIDEALGHLKTARQRPDGKTDAVQLARGEALLAKGETLINLEQYDDAVEVLSKGLAVVEPIEHEDYRGEATRLAFEMNYRLMLDRHKRSGNRDEVTRLAFAVLDRGVPNSPQLLFRLPDIAEAVLDGPNASVNAGRMLDLLAGGAASPTAYAQFFGRTSRNAARMVDALCDLVEKGGNAEPNRSRASYGAECVRSVLVVNMQRLSRPTSRHMGIAHRNSLAQLPPLIQAARRFAKISADLISPETSSTIGELTQFLAQLQEQAPDKIPPQRGRRQP